MTEIREEKQGSLFESMEFVLRHPLLFIAPFCIILSMVYARLEATPLLYKYKAVVSLKRMGSETIAEDQDRRWEGQASFMERETLALFKTILIGERARKIIARIWPDVSEERNPGKYEYFLQKIRKLRAKYDKEQGFLSIRYRDISPEFCYGIVQEAIFAMSMEIKESTEKKLQTGLKFLKKQEEHYKEKIKKIDHEITEIKFTLQDKASQLTDTERILIGEITSDERLALLDKATIQKLATYDEMSAQLELDLLEVQKKRDAVKEMLITGKFNLLVRNPEENTDIIQYDSAIANKEFIIAKLLAQEYLPEHPQIKTLKKEIGVLKELKKMRFETLEREIEEMSTSEVVKKAAEANAQKELEKFEIQAQTLKEKINLINKKHEESSPKSIFKEDMVSKMALRLKELRQEEKIAQRQHSEIRTKLADAELTARIEKEEAGLRLVVIEKPKLPTSPIPFQKTPKIIWGFMISLFVGLGLAYTAEALDTSVRSSSELRSLIHVPILGSVDIIYMTREIRFKNLRKNIIIIFLIAFVLSARFLIKLPFFQMVFGFLK